MKKSHYSVLALTLLYQALAQAMFLPAHADLDAVEPSAKAETDNTSSAQAATNNVVEISASRELALRRQEVAAQVVVTPADLVRYGDTDLANALKRVPGITVETVGGHADVRLRGLGNGYTQILVDGKPVPPGFTLDSLPVELIERVEIYRSGTVEMSTAAVAGTLNIVLKHKVHVQQRQLDIGVKRERGLTSPTATLLLGGEESAWSYTIPLTLTNNGINEMSSVQQVGTDADNVQNSFQAIRQTTVGRSKAVSLSPSITWKSDEDHSMALNTFLSHTDVRANNGEVYTTSLGPEAEFGSDILHLNQTIDIGNADLLWNRKFDNGSTVESQIGATYYRRSSGARFAGFDEDAEQVLDRRVDADSRNKILTLKGKLTRPQGTAHALAFGWDGSYAWRDERRLQIDQLVVNRLPWNIDEAYEAQVERLALFARDEWLVTPRLSTYLGIRWEQLKTRSAGSTLMTAVNNDAQIWSPTLQMLWKLPDTESDQMRLGLARTYHAPDTGDLIPRRYISNSNGPANPDTQGNPNLRPELSWGLDAAYEHYIGKQGLFSASAYVRRTDGVLLHNLYEDTDMRWVSVPINNGKANVRGIEMELKLPLVLLFPTWSGWGGKLNLARNWSTAEALPGPANRLASQTPVSAGAGLSYEDGNTPFSGGADFTFRNGGYVRTAQNEAQYTSVQRGLDVYILWKFSHKDNFRIAFGNIGAGDRVNEAIYFDQTGKLNRATTIPTPISITLNLTHQF